jgi:hypothetical protein
VRAAVVRAAVVTVADFRPAARRVDSRHPIDR